MTTKENNKDDCYFESGVLIHIDSCDCDEVYQNYADNAIPNLEERMPDGY